MLKSKIVYFGDRLYDAMRNKIPIDPLTDQCPDISVEDAYQIQQRMVSRRLGDGEKIIGKKIGVTSRVVQALIGFNQPDFGQLTSGMLYHEDDDISLDHLISPRAEAEVAFVLKHDLIGPGVTAVDVIAATDYVTSCFEIVDSRIKNWNISIQDTVADNASCGIFVLGQNRTRITDVDLTLSGMVLERNGYLEATAAGAAVQGGPVNAVVWLANTLGRLGLPFKKDEIILSGSQSSLIPAVAGDTLRCTAGGVGSCQITFSK